jgi:hypothetical protein
VSGACHNGCDSDPFGLCRECIKRIERERVLRIIEAEIETLPMNVYCASKLDLLIQRIRKGDP